MPRYSGISDLTPAQVGAIIIAIDVHNNYNRDVAEVVNCLKSAVKSVRKRVYEEADKKNIFSIQAVNTKQSRNDRSFKLNYKNRKRLIKHTTKNKANRRKF